MSQCFRVQGDSTYHTLHSPTCRLLCSWSALPHGYLHMRPAPQHWWERNPAAGAQALQSHKPCQRQCIHNSLSQRHTPGPHLQDVRKAWSGHGAHVRLHINLLGHDQSNLFFAIILFGSEEDNQETMESFLVHAKMDLTWQPVAISVSKNLCLNLPISLTVTHKLILWPPESLHPQNDHLSLPLSNFCLFSTGKMSLKLPFRE